MRRTEIQSVSFFGEPERIKKKQKTDKKFMIKKMK